MSGEFITFLQLGFEHVTDLAGYDHMLFVIGLCAALPPKQWRRVLILVTAFTIGHCITLLMAGRYGGLLSSDLVEQLVAFSILLAGAGNLYYLLSDRKRNFPLYYTLTLFFGLVHGLAFSNFFRALGATDAELWSQLLAFNLGVELGQLSTVAWFFLLLLLLRSLFANLIDPGRLQYWWSVVVSGIVLLVGLYLLVGRL
ncbi:HupE / UreJ protein [Lewinellaceae bacterium SD302]|nr:HupE / UreJ protein [Lewinellaceae bacterium SD302]